MTTIATGPRRRVSRRQLEARRKDLRRIAEALNAAAALVPVQHPAAAKVERKNGGDPVTTAERAVDRLLFKMLVQGDEGWLSEESQDNPQRLEKSRVWMVDPLDGTKEYISGIPEWCISIGLIEEGLPVAGGVYNPARRELFLGARETGVKVEGKFSEIENWRKGKEILVLASRSEVDRGEWERFRRSPFVICPVGSVAYKLALVAAGVADATWTEVPKHEWDVAGGVALVRAAQGIVSTPAGSAPVFNRRNPLLDGLVAVSKQGRSQLVSQWTTGSVMPGWMDSLRGRLGTPLEG